MVKKILDQIGLKYREARFIKPPATPYIIYFDEYNGRGADDVNLLREHDVSLELYSDTPDPNDEQKISSLLDSYGIEYRKSDRTWIDSESFYLTTFDFSYIQKGAL